MFVDEIAFELLKRSPFYANLFRSCKIRVDNKIEYPACVLVKNTLEMVLNQKMLSEMPLKTQAGVIEHEFQHIVRRHIQQFQQKAHEQYSSKLKKPANMMVFNYAVDAEINSFNQALKDDPKQGLSTVMAAKGVMDQIKTAKTEDAKKELSGKLEEILKSGGFVFPEFFDQKQGEDWIKYYISLISNSELMENLGMNSTGSGGGPLVESDHSYFEESLKDPDLVDNIVYNALKEAESRTRGRLPGEITAFMVDLEKKKALPWVTILRQFVHSLISTDRHNNWKKVNRRFPGELPGFKKQPKLRILVGLDESGSYTDGEWAEAMNEIYAIHGQGVEIWVAAFDTRITNYYKFNGFHQARSTSGGTSFVPVHEKALEGRFNAVIMLTDGYGDFPNKDLVTYQSLWVMNSRAKAPYGVTIHMPNKKGESW